MKKHLNCLMMLACSMIMFSAYSQDTIYNVVQTRGNGCPEGTATVVASPDGKTLSILFDALQSTVPNTVAAPTGRGRMDQNMDYKVCDVVIESTLEQGQRLLGVELTTQLRGNLEADVGTSAQVISTLMEYRGPFHVGRGGSQTIVQKEWIATSVPLSDDFQIDQTRSLDMRAGGCAARGDQKFRMVMKNIVNTRILPGHEQHNPMALLTLDTADISSKLVVALRTAACGPRGGNVPPGRGGAPSVRCPRGPGSCR